MNQGEAKPSAQEVPFEAALLSVSHCLTEAEAWAECGSLRKAEHLFHLAEAYAMKSGYLELLTLVWSYDGCSASSAIPRGIG
ncbi:MAG: hypothetical protein V4671_02825 [Armatimonadota bacterium]